MNDQIKTEEVAQQFTMAIQILLLWLEQKEMSLSKFTGLVDDSLLDDSHLLTIQQAAKILNISKSHTYQLVQQGQIPCIKIGRAVRVRRKELLEYIDSGID